MFVTKHRSAKGFTLVEMLIVIVIIGVLAGMIMIASGAASDRAEKTTCLADRKTLAREYVIYRSSYGSAVSLDEFAAVVKAEHSNYSYSDGTFTNICPTKGMYVCDISGDQLEVYCTSHFTTVEAQSMSENAIIAFLKASKDSGSNAEKAYTFLTSNKGKSLDSGALASGSDRVQGVMDFINSMVGGSVSASSSWQIYNKDNDGKLYIYVTENNISSAKNNSIVPATMIVYDTKNKTYSSKTSGKVTVTTYTLSGVTYNMIKKDSFKNS